MPAFAHGMTVEFGRNAAVGLLPADAMRSSMSQLLRASGSLHSTGDGGWYAEDRLDRQSVLIAPVAWTPGAWAQNTVTPGKWADDVGLARGPQSTAAAAMGYGSSSATCGPEAWSTDTMSYANIPSCGGVTGAALDRDVGFTGPVAAPTSADATSSTSMLHQQMKELETAAPPPRRGARRHRTDDREPAGVRLARRRDHRRIRLQVQLPRRPAAVE